MNRFAVSVCVGICLNGFQASSPASDSLPMTSGPSGAVEAASPDGSHTGCVEFIPRESSLPLVMHAE